MSNSALRVVFTDTALSDLGARLNTYKNGPWMNAATRNPAYCVVKGGTTVPTDTVTFDQTYNKGELRKLDPILKSVTIIQNGGGTTKLAIEAEATIQCHTLKQFETVEKAFCKTGNEVSFHWGYELARGPGYSSKEIKGFTITTFSFNTTPEGFWIVTFKAIAPAMATDELVVTHKIAEQKDRKFRLEGKTYPVTNLIELLTFWAQGNGKTAIDEAPNGQVTIPDMGVGAVVIYDPEHLHVKDKGAGKDQGGDAGNTNEVSKTNNVVYVTLETIIEMFNKELIPVYKKDAEGTSGAKIYENLKFGFHEKYSYSYIDPKLRSAFPTRVLILGPEMSNYKNTNGKGKDFLEGVTDAAAITAYAGAAGNRTKIDLKRILIERGVILSALGTKIKEPRPSEKITAKTNDDGLKVKDFFNNISQVIQEATGNAIKLVLSMSPEVYTKGSESSNKYVIDEENGYADNIDVWVFNPIDGDGSTRSCEIKSEAGSEVMQAAAVSSAIKQNDPSQEGQGQMQDNNTAGRISNADEARKKVDDIIKNPGVLGDSAFDEVHMQALRDQMAAISLGAGESKKFDMKLYPGIGISAEIDGTWGIHPGCGVYTTQMPAQYKAAKSYFQVMTVTQTFSGDSSDWSTKVEGILTNHTNPNYMGG